MAAIERSAGTHVRPEEYRYVMTTEFIEISE
jgi:hypothetical protein